MAKDILKYPGWMYAYGIASGQLSMQEARVEYKRIYHALRERQRRLKQSKEWNKSQFADYKLTPLSRVKTESQFLEKLQSMASWARSRRTTVEGLREYTEDVASFLNKYGDENGKDFHDFTHSNWKEFGSFMHRIHKAKLDSERAIAVFRVAKDAGMTEASLFKDYQYWKEHQEDLMNYTEAGRALGGRASSKRIRDYIESH